MKLLVIFCLTVIVLCTTVRADKRLVSINAPPSREEFHYKPGSKIPPGVQSRIKRTATAACGSTASLLTAAEKAESVYIHNVLRGSESGSNILELVWDPELASQAQVLANTCTWGHGVLTDCSNNGMGQNLFINSGSAGFIPLNMTGAIKSWYDERKDFSFQANACQDGKICGHYTQVVWARSLKVGCGVARCPTVNIGGGSSWNNAVIVVCNYSPAGNVIGAPMYQPGTVCSNCDSDQTGAGFKCVNNLCSSCTPATDSSCSCGMPLSCVNGGSWSGSTCSCSCPKGFYGVKCENSCTCTDLNAAACGQWAGFCPNPMYRDFMMQNCMGTCRNLCSPPPSCLLV